MPDATDIASVATGLSSVQTSVQAQVGVLGKLLDTETEAMKELLKLLGVGQNLDVTA